MPALRTRMNALALTDALTGLSTRRLWDEELPRELARARHGESPLTLAVLDIDHMSAFNLLRGEREGDRLIKETAARWRGELREVDALARARGHRVRDPAAGLRPRRGRRRARPRPRRRPRAGRPHRPAWRAGTARSRPSCSWHRANDALAAAKESGRNVTIAAEQIRSTGIRSFFSTGLPSASNHVSRGRS